MSSEKSEAQLKNEEEVRRILEQRGYSSAKSKKIVKKSFGRSFSLAPIIIVILISGLAVCGWFYLKSNPFNIEKHKSTDDNESSAANTDQMDFYHCLDSAYSLEISMDDPDFWNKYITRYEQAISCYDKYPSVANVTEKTNLQDKLSKLRENAEKSEANDAEYRANIAQIDAELEDNLARIKKESEEWDQEVLRRKQEREQQRAELDAEYEKQRQKREQQEAEAEAQKQQQEQEAKEKCDNYKLTYGEMTAAEIAESDPEVSRAKNNWANAQKKVRSLCNYGTQPQRDLCNSYRNQELETAESYHSIYTNLLQQKTSYYRNLKIKSCGY